MTTVEVFQGLLVVVVSLFILRVLERTLKDRNAGSVTASALEFLIGP